MLLLPNESIGSVHPNGPFEVEPDEKKFPSGLLTLPLPLLPMQLDPPNKFDTELDVPIDPSMFPTNSPLLSLFFWYTSQSSESNPLGRAASSSGCMVQQAIKSFSTALD